MGKRLCVVLMMLVSMTGCAGQKHFYVAMTPQQMQFVKILDTDYEQLINESADVVIASLGKPAKKKKYTVDGITRERYTYFLIEPGLIDRKKTVEIFFIAGKVSGFTVYAGDPPSKDERAVPPVRTAFSMSGI